MGKINWGRIFLCGILTGGVWYLLGLLVFIFALGRTDFAAAVEAAGRPRFPALPFILHLAGGIWTMWLYAAIRPRYGQGPKTAAVAGSALWVIGAVVDGGRTGGSGGVRGGMSKHGVEAKIGTVEESGEFGETEGEALGRSGAQGHVAQ